MATLQEIILENVAAVKDKVKEIHTFIHGDINNKSKLNFNTDSMVSQWSLWVDVFSFLSYIQRELWGEAKVELEAIKEQGIAANKYFFAREWQKFQYGDDLLVDDTTGKYYYETADDSKQIIKRLAIIQSSNGWVLKVAGEDESEIPVELTTAELNSFKEFVNLTQPPGPKVKVISLPSDKAKIAMNVYYNPLESIEAIKENVKSAYLKHLATIDINGESVYYLSKHIDSIQLVPHVVDVEIITAQVKMHSSTFRDVSRKYAPFSGYLELDPDSDIDTLINYIPE